MIISSATSMFLEQYRIVLLDATWRGAVVLLMAFTVTWLLRRRSASLRHLVWTGAVAMQLGFPLLALWGPRWAVPVSGRAAQVLPAVSVQQTLAQQAASRRSASSGADESQVLEASQTVNSLSNRSGVSSSGVSSVTPSVITVVVLSAIWLTGVLFILFRLVLGTIFTAKLARSAGRVTDGEWLVAVQELSATLGIRRPIKLFSTDALEVPLTWGIVYPIVMLPSDATEWSSVRRGLVLVHEMSHISRVDALSQLVAQIALAIFWFNPLLWLAHRRMRIERELACDDLVLQHGTKASHYADELLAMVQRNEQGGDRAVRPAFAALAMARRTDLEIRLRSILSVNRTRNTMARKHSIVGGIAALAVVTPIATLDVYQSTAPHCGKCEISLLVVTTLTDPRPTLRLGRVSQVKRGSNGYYYVSQVGGALQIGIYDAKGKFIRAVSGQGKARGELSAHMRFHQLGIGDTLLVVDDNQNLHVYAPDGHYVRTVKLPVEGWSLIMLPDGRFVAQENIEGNQRKGFSFHLLTPNGKLIRSFGPLHAVDGSSNQAAVSRHLSTGKNGEIISVYPDRYRIEQWDTTGKLIRVTEPKTDWFPAHDPQQPHFQAGHAAFDGSVYWTQAGIRRPMFTEHSTRYLTDSMRATSFKPVSTPLPKMMTRLQAVEPGTGAVLASVDIRDVSTGSMGDGWLYKRYWEGNNGSRIEVVRAVLGEAPVIRK